MSVESVAKSLVSLCREGKFFEAMEAHYADGIVSVEAAGNEQMPAVMEGIEAVRGKSQWWSDNHEVHSLEILGPYFNQDQFSLHMKLDVTFKPSGARSTMNEVCLYDVQNDKIVKEHFFYDLSGAQ